MTQFHAKAIAYATDLEGSAVLPAACFKCNKGSVEPFIAPDEAIYWVCPRCKAEGRISHGHGKLWDLTERGAAHG